MHPGDAKYTKDKAKEYAKQQRISVDQANMRVNVEWLLNNGYLEDSKKMMAHSDVLKIIYEYGRKAAIPEGLLCLPAAPAADGSPHLEIDEEKYHLVYSERGMEFSRRSSTSIDEIIYWFFDSVTSALAFKYELENRVEGQDCRRIAFAKKRELICNINRAWEDRVASEICEILKNNPFRDG